MRRFDPNLLRGFSKRAVAVLTPEAEQAAAGAPPMDPAAGGMPPQGMPPQGMPPQGQPPMDPAMMGGMPPQGMPPQGGQPPMDPSMGGMPSQGGDPTQDPMFLQFLAEMMGVQFDPQSGQFIDPQGQPVPPEVIMQTYQMFQQEMANAQQGGQLPPMDPAMGGMPPEGMPPEGMPPQGAPDMGGMPPEGQPPMDPAMDGMMNAVLSAVDTVVGEKMAAIEKKLSTLLDKLEAFQKDFEALTNSEDTRKLKDKVEDAELEDELAQELQDTTPVEDNSQPQNMLEALQQEEANAPTDPAVQMPQDDDTLALFNQITGGNR